MYEKQNLFREYKNRLLAQNGLKQWSNVPIRKTSQLTDTGNLLAQYHLTTILFLHGLTWNTFKTFVLMF